MTKTHYYLSLIHFQISDLDVHLIIPQTWQASELYQAIARDRKSLGRWLPWAYKMHSATDEAQFIKTIQQDMVKERMLVLTILINDQPCGMIDIHNLVPNKKGEIGYWLSSKYQGRGVVTKSVNKLCQYAFSELHLKYLDLIAATENSKSIHVAEHASFKLMGIEPHLINNQLDGKIFRKINPLK